MASTSAQSISALLQKSSLDDHDEILRSCNAVLKKSKSDVLAQHAKAIALLKLDRYDEALQIFESAGKTLQEKAPLDYAYSLYKNGNHRKAAESVAGLKEGRGARHLQAQALYRAEDFGLARNLYRDLSSLDSSTERNDLRINCAAVEAQLIWSGNGTAAKDRRPTREDLESFETAFNAACSAIAGGELRQAEVLLKRARELCKHSEELTEEEKATELFPISVQQLYVFEQLEMLEQAKAVASEIKTEEIPDVATKLIARHNLLVLGSQSNPFAMHQLLGSTSRFTDVDKPFKFQQRILDANNRVVDLNALKHDGVARSTAKLLKPQHSASPSPDLISAGVFNAAAHAGGETDKPALKRVLAEVERRPYSVGILLTAIQIFLATKNHTSAIRLLESHFTRLEQSPFENKEEIRFSPGLVALAVALYRSQGRRSRATKELDKASSYWRGTPNPPLLLLQSAATALLESLNPRHLISAGEIFTKLREENPADKLAAAGYVASFAANDISKVSAEVEELSPVSRLTQTIDVDNLERIGISQPSNALAIAQKAASRKRGPSDQASSKPKRVRKSRLPKDYDPAKTPDPERWLPLRDRSNYRPKGKKGKKRDTDRTQGGIVADDGAVKAAGSPGFPPGGAGGGGGNKRNKKKGRK